MEKNEILVFVKQLKARDHVIMFYSKPKDKHKVLFTYLKAGLDQGEAAAYVANEETPSQIKEAMGRFGIDVNGFEKSGALHVIDYKDWYIIGGEFSISKTIGFWEKLYDEAVAGGFKGLRVTGEMAYFLDHGIVEELLKYERALHKVLEFPMTAICAYDNNIIAKEDGGKLYFDLIKAHATVIFAGPELGMVKSL